MTACACQSRLQVHDGPTCGPMCACGERAVEQVQAGTRISDGQRLFAWVCEPCAREARIEREASRAS